MSTIKNICYTLFEGLAHYVHSKYFDKYQREFFDRKGYTTKFAQQFFPKYIDFEKAIKNPVYPYDTLLLNYWLIEVPDVGLKWSKLISNYHYEKNGLINKKAKRKANKRILLLTKRQKEEAKKDRLNSSKVPFLQGEVIRRLKTDPEYAKKVKAIALKN